jgi:hypothetical protein
MSDEPDGMTRKDGNEAFLSRWSRLKQEARDPPPEKATVGPADPKAPAPELPPLDKLTFDSDYRAFFHPKVDEDTRRAALKKLFRDSRFNVMDGMDVYIDDYSKSDPIPPAMLAGLKQAQRILEWARGNDEEKKERDEQAGPLAAESRPAALEERAAEPAPPLTSEGPSSRDPGVTPDPLRRRGPAA